MNQAIRARARTLVLALVAFSWGCASTSIPCAGRDCDDAGDVRPDAGAKVEDAGEVTSDDAGEVTTPDAGEVTTTDAGEVTTTDAGEVTTVDAGEVNTTDAGEVTTVDAGEVTTVDAGEVTTVDAGEVTTVDAGEVTTVDAGEVTRVDAGEVTTVDAGEVTTPDAGVVVSEPADLRVPEDKAHLIVIGYEPWHGPGFDHDQRGGGARPPGTGSTAIQPIGAEPGIDPPNAVDPFPPITISRTFSYTSCNARACTPRTFTTSFSSAGYDSSNAGVIARHRRQIRQLGVDALLFDVTNGVVRYPAQPPGNPMFNMMTQSVPALYAGLSGSDKEDLKLIPLIGVLENADVSDADHGFGKLLDDWYRLATVTSPGRNVIYEGKPLAVLFHAVETHLPTCQGATKPCWQLARDYLRTHRPSSVTDASKSWLDFVTFRHMGGLYDSQPGARAEEAPGTGTNRVTGDGEVDTYWTWVDRFAPAHGLRPSFAASRTQALRGEVEAFTASNGVGGAAWGSGDDGSGLRAYVSGVVADDPLDYCYETRRGGFSCSWGRPGRYAPDATLRREDGVWAFQRFMKIATALRPTFLLVNQWNQFEQTDEGFDFQTTHDLEPANWGADPLDGDRTVDPWEPYEMARAELSAYRESLKSGRIRNVSYRAGVAGDPLVGGWVMPTGDWHVRVNGLGPALAPYLSGSLPDPILTTYDGAGRVVATNDDCNAATKDACLAWSGPGGVLTATLASADGRPGVALLEFTNDGASGLPNASARSVVDLASPVGRPIAGFVVERGSRRLLLLQRGPSLPAFGLTPFAASPSFTLHAGPTPIATSTRYEAGTTEAAAVEAVRTRLGAAPLTSGDAFLIVNVPPGAYTAITSATTNGHSMFELFDATP